MNFKQENWKCRYVAGRDNPLKEFLIPALGISKHYYRIAGYFSSTVLSAAASGITKFIESGESMKLIVGAELYKEDLAAIEKGLATPKELIEKHFSESLKDIEEEIQKDRLNALAWLISMGKLEIKVGYPKKLGAITRPALFHEKIGIFEDWEGNMLEIEGSENETAAAWLQNRESFCLHRSWEEGESKYVKDALAEFQLLWENKDSFAEVIDIPQAIEKQLLRFKKKTRPVFESAEIKKPLSPFPHQKEAIENWKEKNFKGIWSMATGTGKTFTALWAAKENIPKETITIITAPTIVLLEQWAKEVPKISEKRMLECYSGTGWKGRISGFIDYALESNEGAVILCSNATFATDEFISKIVGFVPPEKMLLISDEVHTVGAENCRKVLSKITPHYRIGLSATPKRHYDEVGSKEIMDFFGGVVFYYGIRDAIDDGILTPYHYLLHEAPLTAEELQEYLKLTSKIKAEYAKLHGKHSKSPEDGFPDSEHLTALLNKRAAIRKSAKAKALKTMEIIDTSGKEPDYPPLERCLIYCSSITEVDSMCKKLFSEKNIHALKYTSKQTIEQRRDALQHFKEQKNSFLVAVDCLDQGVDVPACDSAIILASAGEPRQFIQRRGRVLRKAEGKDIAIIHDFVCLPYSLKRMKMDLPNISKDEYNIFSNEIDRIYEFAEYSKNSSEILKKVSETNDTLKKCYLGAW